MRLPEAADERTVMENQDCIALRPWLGLALLALFTGSLGVIVYVALLIASVEAPL